MKGWNKSAEWVRKRDQKRKKSNKQTATTIKEGKHRNDRKNVWTNQTRLIGITSTKGKRFRFFFCFFQPLPDCLVSSLQAFSSAQPQRHQGAVERIEKRGTKLRAPSISNQPCWDVPVVGKIICSCVWAKVQKNRIKMDLNCLKIMYFNYITLQQWFINEYILNNMQIRFRSYLTKIKKKSDCRPLIPHRINGVDFCLVNESASIFHFH